MIYHKFKRKKFKRLINKKRTAKRFDKYGVYHRSIKEAKLANKYLD